jgi:hypothetical protein
VKWASQIADTEPRGAVQVIGELFRHPKVDHWTYTTQQPAVRKILEDGISTRDASTMAEVERVISLLASRGETSFLDLSMHAIDRRHGG